MDLATKGRSVQRIELAREPTLPVQVRQRLVYDPSPAVRFEMASRADATAQELSLLAKDHDSSVVQVVAGHPNTPQRIRAMLETSSDPLVARAARSLSTRHAPKAPA